MVKKHNQIFENLLLISDLIVISISWILSYYIRFYIPIVPVWKGIPPFNEYLFLLIYVVIIWGVVFKYIGLYQLDIISSKLKEIFLLFEASALAILIFISATYFTREYKYSRIVFIYFWGISILLLTLSRIAFRQWLQYLREKGYNLKYVLIVGAGTLGQDAVKRIKEHSELGLKIVGFLAKDVNKVDMIIEGIKVLGVYEDVQDILKRERVDIVLIALPLYAHERMERILQDINDEIVDIKFIPDIIQYITLKGGVEELDGLPIVTLRDSPLYGWNVIIKRGLDIIMSIIAIIIFSPLMIIIVIIMQLTSKGPILYKQERMGLDGKSFNILKFRSMKVGAEDATGAIWTSIDDPRRTKFGKFLRKTSLDELPQLFNVLRGEMSLVGPRPERPVFIEEFRKSIPKYMLRHKVKAGMTGWAQVNGYRGNTSLEKRIEYDIYYIENWSIYFDIKILFLTLWKGILSKNAY